MSGGWEHVQTNTLHEFGGTVAGEFVYDGDSNVLIMSPWTNLHA